MDSIKATIKVNKLDKSAFFKGKNGDTYCTVILWASRDGEDQYGNTHTVKQDLGKDRRGERAEIIGNAKPLGKQSSPRQDAHNTSKANGYMPAPQEDDDLDDIPW